MHNIVSNIGAAAARILVPAVISILSYFSISVEAEAGTPSSHPVKTGIEVLRDRGFEGLVGKRVGLVTNPSGVDRDLRSTIDILYNAPGVELVALPCTKEELGAALGRNSCAVAALTDKGLAAAVVADLAQTNGDLEPLAQALAESSRGKQTKTVGRRRTPRNAN